MKIPGKRGQDDSRTAATAQPDPQAQSEEALRVRARRRLIGAVALVLTGVVVFPLIFETQPKPVASTMSLVIPSQNSASIMPAPPSSVPVADAKAAAAVAESAPKSASGSQANAAKLPAPAAAQTTAVPKSVETASPAATLKPSLPAPAEVAKPAQEPVQKHAQSVPPSAAKVAAPAHPKPQPSQHAIASAQQALAALEGKQPDQITKAQAEAALAQSGQGSGGTSHASSSARYVIQAGAYADSKAAHEVRVKIEHAGFKTYTQVVDTQAGKRIRVRIGPFSSRQQADQALARIKALGLSAVVLTL